MRPNLPDETHHTLLTNSQQPACGTMISSPDDEDDTSSSSSLHVLLVSNLPLGSIQTSSSVKSTERLSSNTVLFRLTPGTTTLFSADGAHSNIAFHVQDSRNGSHSDSSSILQLPEFMIWYPLPTIGGGAPQLLNKSPSGCDLLVCRTKTEKEVGRGRSGGKGDDDGERNSSSSSSSKLAAGQSIAIETAATGTAAAEIVVPIHSAEKRRWRMGYYVVAPRYPRETIAKLLGGGQRQMSPLWFSSRDADPESGELEEPSDEGGAEDVEMEEADEEEEEGSSSISSTPIPPPATKKSARQARTRRRRRRRRQLAEDEIEEEEEKPESEDTDDGGHVDSGTSRTEPRRSGRNHHTSRPGPDPGLTSLSMVVSWAALAAVGGIKVKGQVDISPLGRPRPG